MENENKVEVVNMVEEIVIDFGPICRFCLVETESDISISNKCIADKLVNGQQDTIIDFVVRFSQIKMSTPQHFPTLVCKNCYDLIINWYNFSLMCQQSDLSLRECYQQTLNETKAKLHSNRHQSENSENTICKDKNVCNKEGPTEVNGLVERQRATIAGEFNLLQTLGINHSSSTLNANNNQKCNKISSLSERLKEAQVKLKEDILRTNDIMLTIEKRNNSDEVKTEKVVHSCPQCSLKYTSVEALQFHFTATHELSKKVKNKIRYQCKDCNKSFSDQEKLTQHYKNIHNRIDLTQDDMSFVITKEISKSKKKFYCLHCTPYKTFLTRDELGDHLKNNHNDCDNVINHKVYDSIHFNSKTFTSRSNQNQYVKTMHNINENETQLNIIKALPSNLFKVFICTFCSPPVSFTNAEGCLKHKMTAHRNECNGKESDDLPAVYVNSLNVFKHSEEVSTVPFKIFCKNCDPPMEFTSTQAFVDHMQSLHDKADVENWDVETSKPLIENATENSKKKTDEKMWKCSECPSSYYRKHSLSYHMKEKHNKTVKMAGAKCPDCNESFFTSRRLVQHGISVHQKYFAHFHKVFKRKILQLESENKDGEDEEGKLKAFECDICQRKYSCKNSWKRHVLRAHLGKTETESVICSYCGKTLSNKLNLKSHIEFVHEALFVSCPICKKKINFRTIGKHYKTHEQSNSDQLIDPENQFLCNACGKILKSKKSFEDHQKLHKNIRDQLCDVCGSGFTTKKFLYLHKKTHEGNKRKVFECSQCEKVFSGRHTLNRHLLTHSGQKNFICEICSKCFYTLQELNRHVRYHKKEYRFDCQLCDMRFLDKSRFRHHMMRHRNIRPHKCQFCDKMFIVKRKMNLHMAAKHNVEVKSTKGVWKDPKTYVPLDDLL